ncbi:hypothetical protein [Olleya aquimaris]|uniref:Vitellogenin II n=1 Tax=Olleya aquimaris TaxID=639310 RepID=A0A327R994_9FLAO|nr:hypothetical protein [Olleya aquimaris]RAJ13281.1 hypothetical protein LY08_02184 [Olleya aquimaris]
MKLINYLSNKIPAFMVLFAVLALSSCGSYQYVGQTSDGIYETSTEIEIQETEARPVENNNDYYTNYFKEKALEAEIYSDSDDVFTDIDSYQGTYDETLDGENQNGGWGASNQNVVINVYDNGWNNYGWGWDYPWGWNSTWAWNRPWGFNRWGWNNWGWNNPYAWNYGWGWNAGFGFGWNAWCPPYYGYAYNGFYNNNYYRRGIAYNSGRRGTLANRGSVLSTRNSVTRPRTNTTTRPRTNTTTRPRTSTNTRPRTNSTRPRTNTTRPRSTNSRPRTNTTTPRSTNSRPRTSTSTPRRNNSTPRTSSPSRSNSTRSSSSSRGNSSGGSRRGRG